MKASFVIAILLCLAAFANSCVHNLYANDPYYSAVSLNDGFAGYMATNFRFYNRDAALSYNIYYANMITISPQGGSRSAFVDLGTNAMFGARFNVSLILGNTAYTSIHVNAQGQIVYSTSDIYNKNDKLAFQPFGSDITSVLQNLSSDSKSTSFYPEVGHIYLININDGRAMYLTKMVVLDVSANNATVSLRWDVIQTTSSETPKCFVPLTDAGEDPTLNPASPTSQPINSNPISTLNYTVESLTITLVVVLPVLFAMIVLLGVLMLVMYKKFSKATGYYSSTPTPKPDEMKPLIQK